MSVCESHKWMNMLSPEIMCQYYISQQSSIFEYFFLFHNLKNASVVKL